MVQKLDSGSKLADEAASAGLKVETAAGFKREATVPGIPAGVIAAAFRTAKDGAGQTAGTGNNEWIVFRVTDVSVPSVDLASDEIKKVKDQLKRSLEDEQIAQYVTKLESEIGTSINEAAFAQATGGASNNDNN
jgi:peptidyl-prolyl cis-trans isomerase D